MSKRQGLLLKTRIFFDSLVGGDQDRDFLGRLQGMAVEGVAIGLFFQLLEQRDLFGRLKAESHQAIMIVAGLIFVHTARDRDTE